MKSAKHPVHVTHEFPPLYQSDARVLILGSIPSPKSREQAFYYGHPQNRFWRVLAEVFGERPPVSIEEKRQLALKHGIALWDVLDSCDICGASDASIQNPVPCDISWILKQTRIERIFTTGAAAQKWYEKLIYPKTGIMAERLPSTSPANCAVSFDALKKAYQRVADACALR